ncbi:tail fiber [Escherichia phage pEC-M719-6WT.1]|uniref:Tail fiber n=1 Tax=Escherichia phage pEC-M719-6WT.1 TaxID=3056220 RepID=A0AA51YFN7_9CAUD|nr:tail fiber [Escherichia phage pEC-M719-6WT.1]
MAEYKLSELNSVDTVRSDDLLHLRVIKRPEMLGDEDRKITYANFLASFRLERFLQLSGGNMTGNLGIVKLTYGGKDLFDPTNSSEISIGDTAKTFKVNANGLALKVADATRTAFVYHTLNKPSPADLGMRTNAENDARYAIKNAENTFAARQIVNINGAGITLKSILPDTGAYFEARDSNNALRFTVGNLDASSDVTLVNSKGAKLTLGSNSVSVDKSFVITGQVQPSDFANFDARYFTQNAADQRFVRLTSNNTLSGANNFTNYQTIISDGALLRLKPATANGAVFVQAYAGSGSESWYLGQPDGTKQDVNLFNQMTGATMRLSTEFFFSKALNVTGQVKPSDFSNFDSRYVPSSLTSVIARTNSANTFNGYQAIISDETPLLLKNSTLNAPLYISGINANNVRRWYLGNGSPNNPESLFLSNDTTGAAIVLSNTINVTKTVSITGQVQPSDFSNFDSRYYTKGVSDSRFMNTTAIGAAAAADGGVLWNAKTGLYSLTTETGGSTDLLLHLFQGTSSTPSAQLRVRYRNGGVWYRSARDGYGFEESWTKIYNERDKPTPAELGAYTKAETDQKIATAITNSTDLNMIYPVGMVTLFASNVNPNVAFAGTTWTYLANGQFRTIRVAAEDGSDVGSIGGSDSRTLSVGNIPSHTHSFSATTSSFDYGTKTSNTTGAHTHTVSGSAGSAGAHTHTVSGVWTSSTKRSGGSDWNTPSTVSTVTSSSSGAHTHSVSGTAASNGNHAHTVNIGAHDHTFSGNTDGTGSGAAFDVTNAFIKLMAWVRTA